MKNRMFIKIGLHRPLPKQWILLGIFSFCLSFQAFAQKEPLKFQGMTLSEGLVFDWKEVAFLDTVSAELTKPSYHEIDKLADLMLKNPSIRIEIGSHVGNNLSNEFSLILTRNRVNVIRDYLVEKKVKSENISLIGFGKTRYRAGQLNDRIEIKILSLKD
jgi:OmpA family